MCKTRGVEKNGVFTFKPEHTHESNINENKERKFKQELCVKSVKTDNYFKDIYNVTRLKHPEAAIRIPFAKCENLMYKWRTTTWPRKPDSLREYALIVNSGENEEWRQYNGGVFTFSHVTDVVGSNSVIIMDVQFARKIIEGNVMNIDGTFKIIPKRMNIMQFVTLMITRFNHVRKIQFYYILHYIIFR